jgi:hypothetical protein
MFPIAAARKATAASAIGRLRDGCGLVGARAREVGVGPPRAPVGVDTGRDVGGVVGVAIPDARGDAFVVDCDVVGVVPPPPLPVPWTVTDFFAFAGEPTQGVDFVLQLGALAGVGRKAWIE